MALTINEVEGIALLARLTLKEEEKNNFTEQLNLVLNYANRLNEINTDNVEPLTHILPVYNVFRDDNTAPSSPRDEMMANGSLVEDGQYKVPKIMQEV